MTLPPLPELPIAFTTTEGDVHKLLKAYGQQCREAALEEAAQFLLEAGFKSNGIPAYESLAERIRKLKNDK